MAPHLSGRRIVLLTRHRPVAAEADRDRVRAVRVRDVEGGRELVLTASYFLDATELGDLLSLTGTEYVVGAEAQKETGEPHAPAEANPRNQQAFTYCFAMDYAEGEDHTIDRPAEYDFWRSYVPQMRPPWPGPLLSWRMPDPVTLKDRKVSFDPNRPGSNGLNLWLYRRIADRQNFREGDYSSDICLVNWPQNDYWLGNLIDVAPEEAAKHLRHAKQLSLSLLHWIQTEAPRPDGKTGWKGLRLREDVVGTSDGLAKYPYVRESRRLKAEFTVLEQHVATEARIKATGQTRDEVTAERFPDSVGIGSYRIDLHPSSAGDNYIDVSSLPFQIPLGALIPRRMENLLPACKNLGVTHITNGCYRLHPVEWNIGEAAGGARRVLPAAQGTTSASTTDQELTRRFPGTVAAGRCRAGMAEAHPALALLWRVYHQWRATAALSRSYSNFLASSSALVLSTSLCSSLTVLALVDVSSVASFFLARSSAALDRRRGSSSRSNSIDPDRSSFPLARCKSDSARAISVLIVARSCS